MLDFWEEIGLGLMCLSVFFCELLIDGKYLSHKDFQEAKERNIKSVRS